MKENTSVSRRSFLTTGIAATTASCVSSQTGRDSTLDLPDTKGALGRKAPRPSVRTDIPIVNTAYGPVKGYWRKGVYIWKGLPYGAATGPMNRFQSPRAPTPWQDPRNALTYGPICPVGPVAGIDLSTNEWPFMIPNGPATGQSEDCLRVNIWSPEIKGNAPVMVWLHADGFGGGSSQKYLSTDGENLALTQDVVVVSLNHRVGPLGFSNLSFTGDPRLAQSANAGMADIVLALKWVQENIGQFGGDPDNVTVFGQSGGGFKISVLLAMPAAKGLFHKAIIQSGARLAVHDASASESLGAAILRVLNIKADKNAASALSKLSDMDYLTAARQASSKIAKTAIERDFWAPPPHWFEPTAGDADLPTQPFSNAAVELYPDLPVICGTVRDEASPSVNAPATENLTFEDATQRLRSRYGDKASAAIAAARAAFPKAAPVDVFSIVSSFRFRAQAIKVCERLSKRRQANVFNYVFDWSAPLFEGRPRAFHTSDVAFAFANTDLVDLQTGGGEDAAQLGSIMSSMWAAFARFGDPNKVENSDQIPYWPAFNAETRQALAFDIPPSVTEGRDDDWVDALLGD